MTSLSGFITSLLGFITSLSGFITSIFLIIIILNYNLKL
jgi:hypothetical protein